jgi:hypothetical protein
LAYSPEAEQLAGPEAVQRRAATVQNPAEYRQPGTVARPVLPVVGLQFRDAPSQQRDLAAECRLQHNYSAGYLPRPSWRAYDGNVEESRDQPGAPLRGIGAP